jgi:hypothetical protein
MLHAKMWETVGEDGDWPDYGYARGSRVCGVDSMNNRRIPTGANKAHEQRYLEERT